MERDDVIEERVGHGESVQRAVDSAALRDPRRGVNAIDEIGWLHGARAALEGAGLALTSAEEAREETDGLAAHYADGWHLGTLWSDALWGACQEAVRGAVVVALGPTASLGPHISARVLVLAHPDRPGELMVAPSGEFPAALFARVPVEEGALRAALASLDPARCAPRTRVAKAFMGYSNTLSVPSPYSGQREPAGPHELDRHFNFSPAAASWCWGTAYTDDPVDPAGAHNQIAMAVTLRKIREQVSGALPALTRATHFSRSHLGVEMHRGGLYVWRVAYAPTAAAGDAVARFNAATGYRLPVDLPIDVAAAVHGFEWLDEAWVDRELAASTDDDRTAGLLRVALALAHDDLRRASEVLRRYADHPAVTVRGTLLNAAIDYNWEWFLESLACVERDDDLREVALAALATGVAPPAVSDMGEPLDVYGSGGDEGDADSDDQEEDA